MTTSDTIILAAIAAIPPTIAAIAGVVVSIRNGIKTNETIAKVDASAIKQEEIHVAVNSNLAALKEELAASMAEVKALRETITRIAEGKVAGA